MVVSFTRWTAQAAFRTGRPSLKEARADQCQPRADLARIEIQELVGGSAVRVNAKVGEALVHGTEQLGQHAAAGPGPVERGQIKSSRRSQSRLRLV
jgi:hypothetical protein